MSNDPNEPAGRIPAAGIRPSYQRCTEGSVMAFLQPWMNEDGILVLRMTQPADAKVDVSRSSSSSSST